MNDSFCNTWKRAVGMMTRFLAHSLLPPPFHLCAQLLARDSLSNEAATASSAAMPIAPPGAANGAHHPALATSTSLPSSPLRRPRAGSNSVHVTHRDSVTTVKGEHCEGSLKGKRGPGGKVKACMHALVQVFSSVLFHKQSLALLDLRSSITNRVSVKIMMGFLGGLNFQNQSEYPHSKNFVNPLQQSLVTREQVCSPLYRGK